MTRPIAPFLVYKDGEAWVLQRRVFPFKFIKGFASPGAAIDYAYTNWPWWP